MENQRKTLKIISMLSDESTVNKAISLYVMDYPELIDYEIDQKTIEIARKEREKERSLRNKNSKTFR